MEFKSFLTEEEIRSTKCTPIPFGDTNWVELFRGMHDGDQIELDVPIGRTIRSFKVRVNKAAHQTSKRLYWTESHYNSSVTSFIVKVEND